MRRRTYLGAVATAAVGSIAGCASASDGSQYPPYPDSETVELSGEGVGSSDSFEISLGGPTLVDLQHMGADNFTVTLDPAEAVDDPPAANGTTTDGTNETTMTGNGTATNGTNETTMTGNGTATNGTNETTTGNGTATDEMDGTAESDEESQPASTVATAVGPYDGRSLQSVESGRYVLNVREADAQWEATVYDLPAYGDGVGVPLPIEHEGEQYDVIGPINFGEQAMTEFSFSVSGPGLHRVFLTDREADTSLTVTEINGEGEDSVSQQVGGVGYIEVLSFGSWTFELSA